MTIPDPNLPLGDPRQRFLVCTVDSDGNIKRELAPRPGPAEKEGHGSIIQRCASGDYVWQDTERYFKRLNN